jgi:hypothetical protein
MMFLKFTLKTLRFSNGLNFLSLTDGVIEFLRQKMLMKVGMELIKE